MIPSLIYNQATRSGHCQDREPGGTVSRSGQGGPRACLLLQLSDTNSDNVRLCSLLVNRIYLENILLGEG